MEMEKSIRATMKLDGMGERGTQIYDAIKAEVQHLYLELRKPTKHGGDIISNPLASLRHNYGLSRKSFEEIARVRRETLLELKLEKKLGAKYLGVQTGPRGPLLRFTKGEEILIVNLQTLEK